MRCQETADPQDRRAHRRHRDDHLDDARRECVDGAGPEVEDGTDPAEDRVQEPSGHAEHAHDGQEAQHRVGRTARGIVHAVALPHDDPADGGADREEDQPLVEAVSDIDARDRDSLVGDMHPTGNRALIDRDPRQAGDHDEDEDDLHEQRDVAQRLDEDTAGPGHDPVAREPPHPDEHTEHRGSDDAPERQPDGVDHADPQCSTAGVGIGVDARAEITAQRRAQEVVARFDVLGLEVAPPLRCKEDQREQHQGQREHL